MAKKYSPDFKERAIRMLQDHKRGHASSKWGAAEAVGTKLGVSPHTVYGWLKQARKSLTAGPGDQAGDGSSEVAKRIAELEAREPRAAAGQ